MSNTKKWLHGTEVHFDEWKLPLIEAPHKGKMKPHSAIFFTTSKEYALGAANGTGGLCTSNIKQGTRILNMMNCSSSQSEVQWGQVLPFAFI